MFNKLFVFLTFILLPFASLPADIVQITELETILPSIEEGTLVLFNISEVLLDSKIELGTSKWRNSLRSDPNTILCHDWLTLLVAKKVPHKAVETSTPLLIQTLQAKGLPVMAFTSRGRSEWYNTKVEGVDILTEQLLNKVGIDFTKSKLPECFLALETSADYSPYFHAGILYASHLEKGEFLKKLLLDTQFLPAKVVFVDDKKDSLVKVEKALLVLGIPNTCFWYTRTAVDHKNYDPNIAAVQLDKLLNQDIILTNEEAALESANREEQVKSLNKAIESLKAILRIQV